MSLRTPPGSQGRPFGREVPPKNGHAPTDVVSLPLIEIAAGEVPNLQTFFGEMHGGRIKQRVGDTLDPAVADR